jgi:hypothetical protein
MLAKEVFVNCYNCSPITWVKKGIFKISLKTIWGRGWGRRRNQICGSVEPKEIFSTPQHYRKVWVCRM